MLWRVAHSSTGVHEHPQDPASMFSSSLGQHELGCPTWLVSTLSVFNIPCFARFHPQPLELERGENVTRGPCSLLRTLTLLSKNLSSHFCLAHSPLRLTSLRAQKTTRPVTVLGRLVGGDRRGSGTEESTIDGSAPGPPPAEAGGEFDELPIPSVCRLLRDGWSRRASSSYSPFFDGEGAWSRSEGAGCSVQGQGGAPPFTPPRGAGGRSREDGGKGGDGGEGGTMPVPIVTAEVTIADLSFSLR